MFPYCFRYFRFSSPEIIHGRRRRRKESERTRRERELYRRSSLLLAFLLSLRNSRALESEEKYTVPEIHVFRGSEREGKRSGEGKGAERRSEISENRVSIVVTWIRLPRTDLLSPPLTPSSRARFTRALRANERRAWKSFTCWSPYSTVCSRFHHQIFGFSMCNCIRPWKDSLTGGDRRKKMNGWKGDWKRGEGTKIFLNQLHELNV